MAPVATPVVLPSPQALKFPTLNGEQGTSKKRERDKREAHDWDDKGNK